MYTAVLFLFSIGYQYAYGHGYLMDPPGRSSMWRAPYSIPTPIKDYNDNGLNCGGKSNLIYNGGKCGVCGDPYQGPYNHEAGGMYVLNLISKTYDEGQNITVKIKVTADHRGWFEFRLCVNNNFTKRITHDCLNRHLLQEAATGKTRLQFTPLNGIKSKILKLPEEVVCQQCVLQWKWRTANSPDNVEEEFYGCSDIAIRKRTKFTLPSTLSLLTHQPEIYKEYSLHTKQNLLPTTQHILPTTQQALPTTQHKLSTAQHILPTTQHILPTTQHILPTTQHILPTTQNYLHSSLSQHRCKRIGIPALDNWCLFQCVKFVCPSYLHSICVCT